MGCSVVPSVSRIAERILPKIGPIPAVRATSEPRERVYAGEPAKLSDADGRYWSARYRVSGRRARAWIELAMRQGWDLGALLAEAGISPAPYTQGRCVISEQQAAILVRRLWRATGDEMLGLGSAPAPRGTARLLGFAMLGAPDLGSALRRYVEFAKAVPAYPQAVIDVGATEARVCAHVATAENADEVVVDAMLIVGHRLLSWATGSTLPLRRVEFPYARPDDGVDGYRAIFRAPVVFSAPAAAIVVDVEVLNAPLIRTEAEVEKFLSRAPAGLFARENSDWSVSVQARHVFAEQGLRGNWLSLEELAERLEMSPPTLRRRLREEGVSMRQIREGTLREAAVAGLIRGEETVAGLSRRLGFSEPSAFTRAFRRWTGASPASYVGGSQISDPVSID